MLQNYLLIAFRNIQRQFSYSLINILGLAIGIACSLVIFFYVYDEWSYDKKFANEEKIYRIGISFFNIGKFANGPERLLDVLPKEFDGIETATRIVKEIDVPIFAAETAFTESQVYYTDTAFFHVFDFSFLAGNPRKILTGPNEVVLNESLARKYFNSIDVIGKIILIGKERVPYEITGVVKNPHFNSHLNSKIWISIQSRLSGETIWSSAKFYNYVLLKENLNESDLKHGLEIIYEKYVYPEAGKPMGFNDLEVFRKNENAIQFFVHPLREIYLKSKLSFEISPGGNEDNIYIFSAISVFIMILAAVNFISLTTARASRRAKEVGIRKTLGTSRARLMGQFIFESLMISTMAMILSLLFAQFFLEAFEYITGSPLLTSLWRDPYSFLLFFGFSMMIGLLSGIYPAFYLTSFSPAKVLKGNLVASGGETFRNVLVVIQFSVALILIISTVVVWRQQRFMETRDLGFDQENVLTLDNVGVLGSHVGSFKDELTNLSDGKVSAHTGEPGSRKWMNFYTYQTPVMSSSNTFTTYIGDADYLSVMGMHLIKGRNFSKDLASDTASVILNESAVKALSLGQDPIGAVVNKGQHLIGVVSDFHWESLRNVIAPVAIIMRTKNEQLSFKLPKTAIPGFLMKAEKKWNEWVPDAPMQYHFVDQNFGEILQKERNFGKAIFVFTLLAVFISCLGLYGLSAFTAEQRTKEIGIRKVMGATGSNIVLMLNKKFTWLVLIAAAISVPLSFFILQQWLQGFAYRVGWGISVYLISISSALLIAWITVGFHSLKAAMLNPVQTLKYE